MPSGQRIRSNNVYGTTEDNPLLIGAVSFTSDGLRLLPAISGQHAVIVLDPKRETPNAHPEIVVVTSHLAMGTTATILRGQYGTVAREHAAGTSWAHVPLDEDFIEVLTSGTRPSNPYEGQMIYETDTDRYMGYDGSLWIQVGSVGASASRMGWHLTRVATQSIPTGTGSFTNISWDTEVQDTPSNFTPHATTGTTLTIPTGGDGLWQITYQLNFAAGSVDYNIVQANLIAGGITFIETDSDDATFILAPTLLLNATLPLVAGNTIIAGVKQGASTAQNVTGRLLAYRIGN